MNKRSIKRSQLTLISQGVQVLAVGLLTACGGGDNSAPTDTGAVPLTVPKVAACSTGSVPETGLQGQVPAALRASGFKGFNCNLSLISQVQGEGGNWSTASFTDGAGHNCAYHATAVPNAKRINPGVPVIDITDRTKALRTTSLTTPSMTDPWESLRTNTRRQFLIADNGQNGGGGPEVDIYDISGDCRSPQLLSTLAVGTGPDGGIVPAKSPVGHEGNISPDGLTYYVGDMRLEVIPMVPAHTFGDLMIYLPQQKILFAGDVGFFWVAPFLNNGVATKWIEACDKILDMDVDVIVPGHGPMGTKKDLLATREYLRYMKGEARLRYNAGMSVGRACADIRLGKYASWIGADDRMAMNLVRLYAEFDGTLTPDFDAAGEARAAEEYAAVRKALGR